MTVYGSNYTQKCSKLLQWNMCKVFNVWPKQNTEGLSFMTLKGDAKFEEKLTCGLENDNEYGKFSPEQFKVSKLG